MINLNNLLILLNASENINALRVTIPEFKERYFDFCKALNSEVQRIGVGKIEVNNELGQFVDLNNIYDSLNEGLKCEIKLLKENHSIFITQTGAISYFKEITDLPKQLWFYFLDDNFQSLNTIFNCRKDAINTPLPFAITGESFSAIAFTKPLSADSLLWTPKNIRSWLVKEEDLDRVPDFFRKISSIKLFISTSTENLIVGNSIELFFRGEKTVKINKELSDGSFWINNFSSIQHVCTWLFEKNTDTEARHMLFNGQFALIDESQINDQAKFEYIFPRILDNAILSYKYHLIKSTKDLNKILTELNKTLFEHINKIRQNTGDLISGLWRDFTTVFALLILNFSLKKPDLPLKFWNLFLLALIFYLGVSFFLSSRMGFWFYKSLKKSLDTTRKRVYSYMDDNDFNEYAWIPLRNAQSKFTGTFIVVLVCYVAMIFSITYVIGYFDYLVTFWDTIVVHFN